MRIAAGSQAARSTAIRVPGIRIQPGARTCRLSIRMASPIRRRRGLGSRAQSDGMAETGARGPRHGRSKTPQAPTAMCATAGDRTTTSAGRRDLPCCAERGRQGAPRGAERRGGPAALLDPHGPCGGRALRRRGARDAGRRGASTARAAAAAAVVPRPAPTRGDVGAARVAAERRSVVRARGRWRAPRRRRRAAGRGSPARHRRRAPRRSSPRMAHALPRPSARSPGRAAHPCGGHAQPRSCRP